uniref:Uncharacterized protein n=1 Tax=viral metagenome TaxID=1070528 RepID=A0A6C0C6D5_9ZZZZ
MSELIDAVRNNNIKRVREIISKGDVNINILDDGGNTALHHAVDNGYINIVRELLNSPNININIKNRPMGQDDATPLMIACSNIIPNDNIRVEIAKLLIEAGADVNTQDNEGNTVLINLSHTDRTTTKVRLSLIKLLIENGADPSIPNNHGTTVENRPLIKIALSKVYEDIFKEFNPKQRLAFSKIMIDDKNTPEDIIRKILDLLTKKYGKPSSINKKLLDKMNEFLKKTLKEPPSSNTLIDLYRKQLKNPNLSKKQKTQIRKQKRNRKTKMNIPLDSSDYSSSRKSRSMNSEDELNLGIKMSVMDKSNSRKSRSTLSKSNSRKSRSYNSSEELKDAIKMSLLGSKKKKNKTKKRLNKSR